MMKEEIEKLRQSIRKVEMKVNAVDAKVGFLRDSTSELKESVKDMALDFDAFIEVYNTIQERTDKRLDRLEKHVGL